MTTSFGKFNRMIEEMYPMPTKEQLQAEMAAKVARHRQQLASQLRYLIESGEFQSDLPIGEVIQILEK